MRCRNKKRNGLAADEYKYRIHSRMRLTKFKTTKAVFDKLLDALHKHSETMCFIVPVDETEFYYIASDTDDANQNEDVYSALQTKLISFENCSLEEIENISSILRDRNSPAFTYLGNVDVHLL